MRDALRKEVLQLYRELVRKQTQLQYTDRSWYLTRLRHEFRNPSAENGPNNIHQWLKEGQQFLETDLGGLK